MAGDGFGLKMDSQLRPHSSARDPESQVVLSVRVHRSITEIAESLWDSVSARFGLANTYRFISALEWSRVEMADYWYLLIYMGDELVGTAVVTSFTVSLDLLNFGLHKVVVPVRQLRPGFLRLRILFSGTPISIGRHNVCSKYQWLDEAVIEQVAQCMDEIAESERIGVLCAKEFPARSLSRFEPFARNGFFLARSMPRVCMINAWSDFGTYLSSMRAGYRRQVTASLRKAGWNHLRPEFEDRSRTNSGSTLLHLEHPSPHVAPTFATLYAQTMSRTETKLEILNERFFSRLFEKCSNDLELLALRRKDKIIGAALLSTHGRILHFLLAGLDYSSRDQYDTYFNLLNGIVALAISRNCGIVDLGQTSYHAKLRLGGNLEEMFFYLKARGRIAHFLLRISNRLLFPGVAARPRHVFHKLALLPINEDTGQ